MKWICRSILNVINITIVDKKLLLMKLVNFLLYAGINADCRYLRLKNSIGAVSLSSLQLVDVAKKVLNNCQRAMRFTSNDLNAKKMDPIELGATADDDVARAHRRFF